MQTNKPAGAPPIPRIVCYSGGHSSGITAIEVVRRFGTDGVVLLNHDIIEISEASDIKRFKREVANYLELPITFANMPGWETKTQFDVVIEAKAFKVGNGTALCTNRMKTRPFEAWLNENVGRNAIIYYGFDRSRAELLRVQRRSSHLATLGFKSDYPLALWERRTIWNTEEIGISKPNTYGLFKHANCVGCLKAGRQHWYVVYCTRPDIWERGKCAEEEIGYTIIKGTSLEDLEPLFERMKRAGIEPTEHIPPGKFWANVRRVLREQATKNGVPEACMGLPPNEDESAVPCECAT